MGLFLTQHEQGVLEGAAGPAAAAAMRIVAGTARMLGAARLVPVASAHVDGCLYHGDSGTLFIEHLVQQGGRTAIPTTLNVGALDLLHAHDRMAAGPRAMARRMMDAYQAIGCRPTWTCAPYQAGHRPALGEDVAWGESNAVVFCNSVLGARTNRYGDYLDIAAALIARAPLTGLHIPENRRARLHIDASALSPRLLAEDSIYPVLGAWLGHTAGEAIAVFTGLPRDISEDRLKALGAAAASSGAVGLFHIVGTTPEAPDLATALGGQAAETTIRLTAPMLHAARQRLSTATITPGTAIDAVAVGSPHFSAAEFTALRRLLDGRACRVPLYACTGRHTLRALEADGSLQALQAAGVRIVTDTCIVVTPILPGPAGLLVTNSGKFAHYTTPNTGWQTLFGSLSDCAESAVSGTFQPDSALWS